MHLLSIRVFQNTRKSNNLRDCLERYIVLHNYNYITSHWNTLLSILYWLKKGPLVTITPTYVNVNVNVNTSESEGNEEIVACAL